MKEKLIKNNWLKIILITFLVIMSLTLTNLNALAQGEEEGEADSVVTRQNEDKTQTQTEAEELARLQKEDEEICKKKETDGSLGRTGGGAQTRPEDYNQYNPNGDRDGDGIPNSQDNDNNDDGAPDTTPTGPVPPACQDGDTAGYIAANEGIENQAYTDSRGYRTIGIGHQITGNEPFSTDGTLTDSQIGQLYDSDMATARNCAQQSSAEHGVDWNALSPERQTVLTDMSFNMGCGGGQGVAGFDRMWGDIREGQRGNQDAWNAAGDEILDSDYGNQVGGRADHNADIMRTSDGSIIDQQTASHPDAQGYCGGTVAVWQKSFGLLASLFGSKIAEAIGGLYVPVIEQDGILRQDTTKIKDQTKNIENLSVQICTHLRAIRRIQSRFEQKMVEDAMVMRIKSTEIEKYRQATFGDNGTIKTGYATLDENGKQTEGGKGLPLFVMDNQTYLKNASDEGAKIALDNIIQNNNSNNTAILAGLQAEDGFGRSGPSAEDIQNVLGPSSEQNETVGQGPLDNIPILSTLLKPIRNTFAWLSGNSAWADPGDPPDTNQTVDSDQFWNSFINVVQTNPGLAYLRAQGDIEQSRNAAILAARDTAAQGQGFLPVRNCLAKTSDGKTCAVWGIVQPGIINKETDAAAINARLDQYIGADSMGEVTQGNEPNVAEIINNKPSAGGGGAVGPGMTTPEEIPDDIDNMISDANTNPRGDGNGDPTGNGNGPANNADWGSLTNLIGGFFGNNSNESGNPESDDLIKILQQILQLLSNQLNAKPWIIFKAKDKGNDISLVYWYSPNASGCVTDNKWLGGDGSTVKETGVNLTKSGSLRVTIKSGESATYNIKCNNANGNSTMSLPVSR